MAKGKPLKDRAFTIYKKYNGKITPSEIAKRLGCSPGTIRTYKNRENWDGQLGIKTENPGGYIGNQNAKGPHKKREGSGPHAMKGTQNGLKHGAYKKLYVDQLCEEDRELYEIIRPTTDLESEIKLMRLRIAKLLDRDDLPDDVFDTGLVACMEQLRKLVQTKSSIDSDQEKFEFHKYKTEIELKLKGDRLVLEQQKLGVLEEVMGDDGFLDALRETVKEVWDEE